MATTINTGGLLHTSASVPSIQWNILSETDRHVFVLVYWVLASSPFVPGTGDSAPESAMPPSDMPYVAFTVVIAVGASLGGATGYAINPARDFGPRFRLLAVANEGQGKLELELRLDPRFWGHFLVAPSLPELFNLMN